MKKPALLLLVAPAIVIIVAVVIALIPSDRDYFLNPY